MSGLCIWDKSRRLKLLSRSSYSEKQTEFAFTALNLILSGMTTMRLLFLKSFCAIVANVKPTREKLNILHVVLVEQHWIDHL